MTAITAIGLRVGSVIIDDDGEECLVERRELRPPTSFRLMIALTLRGLETGVVRRIFRAAFEIVEQIGLQEQELECLYLTDSGCVLFDPVSFAQYDVAQWVGAGLSGGLRAGQRLVAGFWRGRPITLRQTVDESE